jgi:hypothetical protein
MLPGQEGIDEIATGENLTVDGSGKRAGLM